MTPDPREPDHDRASARGVAEYHQRPPAPRLAYLMGVLDKLLRVGEGRKLKALQGLVPDINSREAELQKLSDADLRARTGDMRQQLDNGADLDDLLLDAFAVVREAASRTIGQRHYDVQMMGGAALHFGWVAEMKTGEGKTLVSTLPVYLNGLTGKGVHVITVNDYLARRDAEWMGRVHGWLGLDHRLILPDSRTTRPSSAPSTPATSPMAPTTSSGSTTCATTWPPPRPQGAAGSQLRHRRRGRLDPHRRGPHAADHLGQGRRRRQALLPFASIVRGLQARRRLRRGRREAQRGAH
jgi:hypothetical protein